MTISSRQIRAARGLLNLSQKDVAHKAVLSINALNNIERETGSPRAESMRVIEKALTDAGVEFLEKDGVRLAGEQLEIEKIEGPDILVYYYDDILKTFPSGGGEVLLIGKDNRRLQNRDFDVLRAYKKFEAVAIKSNIKERVVFLENDTNFLATRNIYRWVSREYFAEVPMGIYGNNVAIMLWGPPVRMVIIRNPGIAETFRQNFEAIWSLAKPVPDEIYQFHCQTKTQKTLDRLQETEPAGPEQSARERRF